MRLPVVTTETTQPPAKCKLKAVMQCVCLNRIYFSSIVAQSPPQAVVKHADGHMSVYIVVIIHL